MQPPPENSSSGYEYGVLCLSKSGLSEASHTLVIAAEGSEKILVLFDYLIYTYMYGMSDSKT